MRRRILTLALVLLAATAAAFAETDPVSLVSPDGKLLLDTSLLGIALQDQEPILGETVGLSAANAESIDETYTQPGPQRRNIRNHYNSLIAQYYQNGSLGRRVNIEARAYDDGVAFRYYIARTSTVEDLRVEEELTDFHFAQDGDAYTSVLGDYQSNKGEYSRSKLSGLKRSSLLALPFLVEQPGVGWAAITEAQIDNFPGMYVFHPEGTTMRTTLAPRQDNAALAMQGVTPAETPWRVLMVASEPRNLLESDIVRNLNPATAIANPSWVKQPKDLVAITDTTALEEQFARLEKAGVAGVRIDLKNRADQQMIEIYRRAAKAAAEHHLMVEFQNGPTPDGIERTWPNVVPREDTAFSRLLASINR
jgi:hypothetical protein